MRHALFGVLAGIFVSASANAAVVNVGFENGLTGWTTTGNVIADNAAGTSFAGTFSALLTAEVPHNSATPSTLSQVFNLTAGEQVTFYAQFNGILGGRFGFDTANVTIDIADGIYNNVLASWVVPTNSGVGLWQTLVFTAPNAGSFEFRALVDNVQNSSGLSTLRIDAPQITAAVPEPSTWALMLLGFAGLAGFGYFRNRKSSHAIA